MAGIMEPIAVQLANRIGKALKGGSLKKALAAIREGETAV